MASNQTISQRFEEYQPSKTLWFWSVAGAVVLTMIVGFTAGGWTTAGTASEMAKTSAMKARAELVANLCVQKFITASNAGDNLAKLKGTSSYQRDSFISDGGWVKLAGMKKDAPGAADLCAEKLAAMDTIPTSNVAQDNSKG
ncbi:MULTISPECIES: hypothetical protein [unclassified Mesorhizobium]|uniref:hypothetical protein n=1 Tax=unclassified Mesorhizobium TaxID=325217 RepID=UPI000BAEAC4B|nr:MULTISPECIES: hypothetical protein [unclassified Mesorhizobium]TGT57269.1 hypothetical protein EN813_038130 [Mesorhizobium sp. M00.F.Ca.ET.170.01.1.1]AZO11976.1 hypothetical protein EJ074_24850 [Mesorhizobium sp. M3A.F.Ca.ET.080.04.2.1]PBB86127.1 hypothetical protein CK216_13495 [Mesorhizobium sp. WSM3876]RWB66735.1 MAG: hypothetical protein EOQ49_27990 [Mesorhizobium sp.]RWB90685.1 MAG: hypothetical protein EOQ52_08645 [Mesorhizobium sp.]